MEKETCRLKELPWSMKTVEQASVKSKVIDKNPINICPRWKVYIDDITTQKAVSICLREEN